MAKAISDEELQLKKRARRRLVGAIALVLLVVVFLPMFLDSEPQPLNQDIAITIPQIPAPETPAPAPASPAPIAGMPNALPPPSEPSAAEPVQPGAPAASAPKAEPQATQIKPPRAEADPKPGPRTTPHPVTSPSGEGYVVQLGAFSNASNAKALQKKLQENKFKAYTELIKSPGGDRTRVRVGPYASREAADKARDQLKVRKLIIGDATVVRQGD